MSVTDLSPPAFASAAADTVSRQVSFHWEVITKNRAATVSFLILVAFVFLGLFGPILSPHDPISDYMRDGSGDVIRLSEPATGIPMGTTQYGKDVLSQFLTGARPTLIAGAFGGFCSGILGFLIGLTSGYFGGIVDQFLMRLTDLSFAVPALPIELVILSFVQPTIWLISLIIFLLVWKLTARVVRSEVLKVKEKTYVKSARVSGAGHFRTMFLHVAPNVLPIGLLYSAYSTAWAISAAASLAFLGFGDAGTTSWGRMMRAAFQAGALREAWWWAIPPGLAIAAVTVAVFFVGRAYEEEINPALKVN